MYNVYDISIKFSSNLPNEDSVTVAEIRLKGACLLWIQEDNQYFMQQSW